MLRTPYFRRKNQKWQFLEIQLRIFSISFTVSMADGHQRSPSCSEDGLEAAKHNLILSRLAFQLWVAPLEYLVLGFHLD